MSFINDIERESIDAIQPEGSSSKHNAFTELMKPKKSKSPKKPKPVPPKTDAPSSRTVFAGRHGLGAYTADPEAYPTSRVIYHNEKFVVINDLYPKATVHLLILPRDEKKIFMYPDEAFDDPAFLAECQAEEVKVRSIVADELRRRFGQFSETERPRREAQESDDPPEELPTGRDWAKEVISGIHATPSMSHLHIHVLSKDMVSDTMTKRNHYQSFTTDFLVPLDEFPLAKNDHRRRYGWMSKDLICWRCGKNFENKMTKLKPHLTAELNKWKKE